MRPHRRQPTRLRLPWDSPGRNIGVGCHFLLQRMKVKSESEVTQSCPTLSDPMDCSLPGSSVHGIFQARGLEWGALAFSGLVTKSYLTLLRALRLWLPGSSVHGISQTKNTGVGCHFLLQGIFSAQGSNPHFLCQQADSFPLSHLGSPN